MFGLGPADIDDERGVLHVRRQVRTVGGKQYAALPKGARARGVDLPDSVARELKRHLAAFRCEKWNCPGEGRRRGSPW